MKEDVLTIEHLEALRNLPLVFHPTFDVELFKANNPRWRESLRRYALLEAYVKTEGVST